MDAMKTDIDLSKLKVAESKYLSILSAVKNRVIGEPVSILKLYNLGYFVFFGGLVCQLIFNAARSEYDSTIFTISMFGGVLIWASAFGMEGAARTLEFAKNRYFLGGLALLSVLIFKLSSLAIGRFVNDTTGVDPSELPDAISALLVIFVPLTWLYTAFALLAILAFGMMTLGALLSAMVHSEAQVRAFFARLIVTFFIITYGFIFADFLSTHSLRLGKWIVVAAEYFEDSRCTNLSPNELVAHLEDGISIFNVDTESFRLADCVR